MNQEILSRIEDRLSHIEKRLIRLETIISGDGDTPLSRRVRETENAIISHESQLGTIEDQLSALQDTVDELNKNLNRMMGKMTILVILLSSFLSVALGLLQKILF